MSAKQITLVSEKSIFDVRDLLQNESKMKNNDLSATPLNDEQICKDIEKLLVELGFQGLFINSKAGPWLSLLEFKPDKAVRAADFVSLGSDIARMTGRDSVRISIVPKKDTFMFEMPHPKKEPIPFERIYQSIPYQTSTYDLPVVIGTDVLGEPVVFDLGRAPSLLMAGMTGSGKSVCLNAMLLSLLNRFSQTQCRFALVDTKMLELTVYEGLPHLLSPIATDADDATKLFQAILQELENRYCLLARRGVRNIRQYNTSAQPLSQSEQDARPSDKGGASHTIPYIVVAIDDLADLMRSCPDETERFIDRVAKMGRAVGIHMIALTTKMRRLARSYVIEDSFSVRLGFQLRTAEESHQIIGQEGCEMLMGGGDALLAYSSGRNTRVHGAYVSDEEIEAAVDLLKNRQAYDEKI